MAELTTLLRLQHCIQYFCPYTKRELICYHANLASPTCPHDILSVSVVIPNVDLECPLSRGACIFATGKLFPGEDGTMLEFEVTEYTRVDRVLSHIPNDGVFKLLGVVETLSYLGGATVVIQVVAQKHNFCYFAYVKIESPHVPH